MQTAVSRHESLDHAAVEQIFDDLTAEAGRRPRDRGLPPEAHQYSRTVDLRYFGQAYEVRVAAPTAPSTRGMPLTLRRASTTSTARSTATTSATTRATGRVGQLPGHGVGPISRPVLRELDGRHAEATVAARAHRGTRPVCFDPDDGFVDTDLWWRPDLLAGDVIEGPAIIEEFGSTLPVHPGFGLRVDALGNLVITKSTDPKAA